jgi:hypothetical protein
MRKGLIRLSNSPAMINPIAINSRRTAVKKRILIYLIITISFYLKSLSDLVRNTAMDVFCVATASLEPV